MLDSELTWLLFYFVIKFLRYYVLTFYFYYIGEKVVLYRHDAVKIVLQLQGAVKVVLQHQDDTRDNKVGVPHCLLYAGLLVQVLGQQSAKMP